MLRELPVFGALAPSYLFYFLASILLFVILDRRRGWRRAPPCCGEIPD